MPRDLYEDLAKIEDRGKRLKKADDSQAQNAPRLRNVRTSAGPQESPRPGSGVPVKRKGPPRILSASLADRPSPSSPAPGVPNGGAEADRYKKRDIYEDLSRIEERGKRKKESIFGRRKD